MKRIYKGFIVMMLLLGVTSCNFQEDSLFDESSAARVENSINDLRNVLSSAPNGWRMYYFTNNKYGGFNMLMSFTKDGKVTASSELTGADVKETSDYSIYQSGGVVLSFDSYNKVIHYFSDPVNPDGIGSKGFGLEGDFEFKAYEVSKEKIVLRGLKRDMRIVMVPLPADKQWADVYARIEQVEKATKFKSYTLTDGDFNAQVSTSNHVLSFVYEKDGQKATTNAAYIIGDDGLIFSDTITLGTSKFTRLDFTFDDSNVFNSDMSAVMVGNILPGSQLISIGSWYSSYSRMSEKLQALFVAEVADLEKSLGYKPTAMYFNNGVFYYRLDRYLGTFTTKIVVVSDTEVQFTIVGDTSDANANYFYTRSSAFKKFIQALNGNFEIQVNDPKVPTEMTFVSKTDGDISFKVIETSVSPLK